jgi:uncharacterized protein DUF1573
MNQPIIKKTLSALTIALLIALSGAQAVARQRGQEQATAPKVTVPKAVIPLASYDFGDVYKGELISYTFAILNQGNGDLVIKDFEVGCGCSVVESDKIIPAGHEGRAQLEVNTATQAGPITKIATLHTNDPARPNIVLSLAANVLTSADGGPVRGVLLRPGKYIGPVFVGPNTNWGNTIQTGQKARAEFSIMIAKGPLTILGVEGSGPYFVTRLETVEAGKSYKLIVENTPFENPGAYSSQMTVITDSPLLPSFRLSLYLNVLEKQ